MIAVRGGKEEGGGVGGFKTREAFLERGKDFLKSVPSDLYT